jgi:hypothetical protein
MPFDEGENRGGGGNDNTPDLTAVLFFLHGAACDTAMHNTYTGREAFDAFARLIGREPDSLWTQIEARHG